MLLSVNNLHKTYTDGAEQHAVLSGVNLTLAAGKSLAITGESGSGKSTLLHLLAALDKPDSGEIWVNQQALQQFSARQADTYRKSQLGIVFQRFNLIDCLPVSDNIRFPARLNSQVDEDYIQALEQQLGIHKLLNKFPMQLSGGEQQRVAIARALAHKPRLILADEPTGNLDDANSSKVMALLLQLCQSHDTALVIVTHSREIAAQANQHLHLHQGRLAPPR